jgi:hydroxypyruvate isomerase
MPLKQSVCLPMLNTAHIPLAALIPEIARIGFAAVEIWGRDETFEELARLCQENGLVIATMVGHASLASGMNDPSQHARIEAELHQTIDLAAQYHIPGLICFSGNRRPGQSEDEAIQSCVQGFKRVAPYAEKMGINLNMELLNSKVDHPGYQCDHTAWGAAVCKQVNSPRVKLLYDIYHMQIMEGDVIHTIRDNIALIGHFHTAGVPGRQDIDETQELNYAPICRAIDAAGYDLYLAHEFRPRFDVLTSLRRAFEICNAGE